ncbi:hypothetical protein [Burkholderia contaminans]|uniref:hypothetical protein n=1 Tax=Burkholderia contaminans TaxID=488447 RepID=UPI0021AB235F|nr:hypothetical protein [Burkholderia contaminans]
MKPYGRNAQKPLDPNDRRYDHDVERTMRCLSLAGLSDLLANDDGHADGAEAKAGFADVRRTP